MAGQVKKPANRHGAGTDEDQLPSLLAAVCWQEKLLRYLIARGKAKPAPTAHSRSATKHRSNP